MVPAIPAAAILGGTSIIGGIMGSSSAAAQNREEREWQEMMASTQYQRAVKDMRRAGLNPAMLYGKGSMSSPVSGGARQEEGRHVAEGVRGSGLAALQALSIRAQIADLSSAAKLKDAQAEGVIQDNLIAYNDWMGKQGPPVEGQYDMTSFGRMQRERMEKEIALLVANAKNVEMDTARLEAQKILLGVQTLAAKLGIPEAEAWARYWRTMPTFGVGVSVAKDIGGIFNMFRPKAGPGAKYGGPSSAGEIQRRTTTYYK